jgi:hypothetical protein
MRTNALRLVALLLTAVTTSAGLAHLFALPNKISLPRESYLTVQQIYRGWALLGVAFFGALAATTWLAVLARGRRGFYPTLLAALSLAASLIVFFAFTYPANQQTAELDAAARALGTPTTPMGILARGGRRAGPHGADFLRAFAARRAPMSVAGSSP